MRNHKALRLHPENKVELQPTMQLTIHMVVLHCHLKWPMVNMHYMNY